MRHLHDVMHVCMSMWLAAAPMATCSWARPLAQAVSKRRALHWQQQTGQMLQPQRAWQHVCSCHSHEPAVASSSGRDAATDLDGSAAAAKANRSRQQKGKATTTSEPFWTPARDDAGPGNSSGNHLKLVLVHAQIPQNTGNVARTCAATGIPLHLVGPLGFDLDDKKLRRAGLDYWPHVCAQVHPSWDDFFTLFQQMPPPKRLVAFSVHTTTKYSGPDFQYLPGDWLCFGAETTGLPPQARTDIVESGGHIVTIPIDKTHVRSLNLAVSVGVGVFEALRQLGAAAALPAQYTTDDLTAVQE